VPRGVPFTPETAKTVGARGGKASAEVRAGKRHQKPEKLARRAIARDSEALAKQLVQMALGKNEFVTLEPKDRMTATIKALEYGIGRPAPAPRKAPEPEEEKKGVVEIA